MISNFLIKYFFILRYRYMSLGAGRHGTPPKGGFIFSQYLKRSGLQIIRNWLQLLSDG